MFKRQVIIALLGIGGSLIWSSTASATTCATGYTHSISYKSIGGTLTAVHSCTLNTTGSNIFNMQEEKINPKDSVELGEVFTPDPLGRALLLCQNQGGNVSPGVQVITVYGGLTPAPGFYSAFMNVKKENVVKGTIYEVDGAIASPLIPSAVPNTDQYYYDSNLHAAYLRDSFCPNSNWVAVDYTPCDVTIKPTRKEYGSQTNQSTLSCHVDNPSTSIDECSSLSYHFATDGSAKFDSIPYYCTEVTP